MERGGNMDKAKLCGFIFCHGHKDFSIWETDAISKEDSEAIQKILSKYDTEGTSVRNCWDSISDIMNEEY